MTGTITTAAVAEIDQQTIRNSRIVHNGCKILSQCIRKWHRSRFFCQIYKDINLCDHQRQLGHTAPHHTTLQYKERGLISNNKAEKLTTAMDTDATMLSYREWLTEPIPKVANFDQHRKDIRNCHIWPLVMSQSLLLLWWTNYSICLNICIDNDVLFWASSRPPDTVQHTKVIKPDRAGGITSRRSILWERIHDLTHIRKESVKNCNAESDKFAAIWDLPTISQPSRKN